MNVDEYQRLANRTLIDTPDFDITPEQVMLSWNAIGLTGEAGEVADLIKKGIYHQHGLEHDKLIKELGDVLWYVAALCKCLDVDMSEVMQQNIDKLMKRYPGGYSTDASKNRLV